MSRVFVYFFTNIEKFVPVVKHTSFTNDTVIQDRVELRSLRSRLKGEYKQRKKPAFLFPAIFSVLNFKSI